MAIQYQQRDITQLRSVECDVTKVTPVTSLPVTRDTERLLSERALREDVAILKELFAELALRVDALEAAVPPKVDRAAYMREYRKRKRP